MRNDIVFLSSGEPNAEANWTRLQNRFPSAKRVDGVVGILDAHAECAHRAKTEFFYVVDADNEVLESFDFSFAPTEPRALHVWRCRNAVNDLVYGYGAIKLFPKSAFDPRPRWRVDLATSLSLSYRIVPELASVTRFNSDPFSAWKGAFRECVKLSSRVIVNQKTDETQARLETWCSRGHDRPFGEFCVRGAIEGREYGFAHRDDLAALARINDYGWLREKFGN